MLSYYQLLVAAKLSQSRLRLVDLGSRLDQDVPLEEVPTFLDYLLDFWSHEFGCFVRAGVDFDLLDFRLLDGQQRLYIDEILRRLLVDEQLVGLCLDGRGRALFQGLSVRYIDEFASLDLLLPAL